MKHFTRSVNTYILYVLLPTIIVTFLLGFYRLNELNKEYSINAKEEAITIMQPIDDFLTELSSDIELLGTAFNSQPDLISIEETLNIMNASYAMKAEFFYTNLNGEVIVTSNPSINEINIAELPFFQEVIESQQSTISTYQLENEKSTQIISAFPRFNQKDELEGMIVGFIPSTYLTNQFTSSTNSNFLIEDELGRVILQQNFSNDKEFEYTTLSTIPWKVYVDIQNISETKKFSIFTTSFLFIALVTHFLYLLIRLEDNRQKMQADNERRLELVATVAGTLAHEIRNPLTGVQGFISLLKQNRVSEEEEVYFSVIETEIKRINTIVSEFLILGKPTVVATDTYSIQYIINQIIPIIESEAQQREIHLKIDLPIEEIHFICNKDHIKQLILNLAKNGMQAMSSNGTLTISITQKNKEIIFAIQDTGEGIPTNKIHTIFEPFITTKEEGTGLGLVVCKQIVETYHGKIDIQSTIGKGTTFIITIPLNDKTTFSPYL